MALPNGLPIIVSFLAASRGRHRGAAESRRTRKTSSASTSRTPTRGCCCFRPTARTRRGAPPAIACRSSPSTWTRRAPSACRGVTGTDARRAARGRRRRAGPAHERQHRPAQARAAERTRTCRSRRGNVARSYALIADDVSLCVMPLFHVHGLVASTLATLATGGTVVVPAKFSPLSFWRVAQRSRRDVVFGGADAPPAAAGARRSRARRGRPAPRSCASSARAARRCRRR